ncbi:T9SS type A sorting domain-containing protein [Mucilaginibacter limnophilus]|uniref:T9SS type A sorting domain-containing protein n=1 Tax=Mucilaginibacter limnophilus TaxID=1932778 RepID=A0A437MQU6_9SPHI|nr:T9SS type A sorting domain-containing protein [Mucilaginibacter limnophilus]RVU00027.1 T9SS type A sorting domain-containing protein [Mucilaginibacter limnophilus]
MKRKFTYLNLWLHVIALAITINFAFAANTVQQDTTIAIRKAKNAKNSYLKNGLPFALPPLKPGIVSTTKVNVNRQGQDEKLLSNVQVYPNPVTNQQLNVSYEVSRNTNITIKIVDLLGNDIATIFSQRVESGDQKFSYNLNNKLSRGFYFVRIMAGTESTIKKLSIL